MSENQPHPGSDKLSPNVKGRQAGGTKRKRPRNAYMSQRCARGPFATREDFWIQLHEFLKLEEEAKTKGWLPTTWKEAAQWFEVTVEEMNRTITSRTFVKFCEARVMLSAKMATASLDELAVQKLRKMAVDGSDREFLQQYYKRQELIGFDKVSIDDIEEISDDEGNKLLEEFTGIWCELSGGIKPNLWKFLPRILGTRTGPAPSGDQENEPLAGTSRPAGLSLSDRPSSTLDSLPETVGVPQSEDEVHLHVGSESAGENGLVGG